LYQLVLGFHQCTLPVLVCSHILFVLVTIKVWIMWAVLLGIFICAA
jgi:hypothetical protein